MKPLSCQKGFAIPIIVIIIAVFSAGLLGSAVYPQVKLQMNKFFPSEIEKMIVPKETEKDTLENENQTEKATEETQSSQDSNQGQTSDDKIAQEVAMSEDEEGKAKGTDKKMWKRKTKKQRVLKMNHLLI